MALHLGDCPVDVLGGEGEHLQVDISQAFWPIAGCGAKSVPVEAEQFPDVGHALAALGELDEGLVVDIVVKTPKTIPVVGIVLSFYVLETVCRVLLFLRRNDLWRKGISSHLSWIFLKSFSLTIILPPAASLNR